MSMWVCSGWYTWGAMRDRCVVLCVHLCWCWCWLRGSGGGVISCAVVCWRVCCLCVCGGGVCGCSSDERACLRARVGRHRRRRRRSCEWCWLVVVVVWQSATSAYSAATAVASGDDGTAGTVLMDFSTTISCGGRASGWERV